MSDDTPSSLNNVITIDDGHRRCAGALQELQVGRGWTDTLQALIRPERPNQRDITVRRRDDADDALRSGPEHAGAFGEMKIARHRGMKKAVVALAVC
jgi:hypothetical protein